MNLIFSMVLQYGNILRILFSGRIFLGKNPQGILNLDELRDKLASIYDVGKIGAETHPDGKVNHWDMLFRDLVAFALVF